jgi:hypothetical protein
LLTVSLAAWVRTTTPPSLDARRMLRQLLPPRRQPDDDKGEHFSLLRDDEAATVAPIVEVNGRGRFPPLSRQFSRRTSGGCNSRGGASDCRLEIQILQNGLF